MPPSPALRRVGWAAIAELQGGIISRGQLLDLDLTSEQAKSDINTGRWQRIFPGVYATFTGPIGTYSRVWAALLYAGQGAAASHGTALWLWKLADETPAVIDVVVPESRRVLRQPGLRVHRRRALDQPDISSHIHPSAQPARLRVEEAVLDHCDSVAAPTAIDLVLRAAQRRVTTADRLRRSMQQRPRQRWRSLLLDVLAEVQVGVASNLELAYRRDVEETHHLPVGTRNESRDWAGRWPLVPRRSLSPMACHRRAGWSGGTPGGCGVSRHEAGQRRGCRWGRRTQVWLAGRRRRSVRGGCPGRRGTCSWRLDRAPGKVRRGVHSRSIGHSSAGAEFLRMILLLHPAKCSAPHHSGEPRHHCG